MQNPARRQPVSSLTKGMALAYLLAIVLGVANGLWGTGFTHEAAGFISTIFIKLFKFVAIPLIAVTLITTLSSLSSSRESGSIFGRTLSYTLLTTVISAALAAALFLGFAPENVSSATAAAAAEGTLPAATNHSYLEYALSVIPDNFVTPFSTGNVLSVLLIAVAVGLGISKLPAGSSEQATLTAFFKGVQSVLFILVRWLIAVLPVGIFAFISGVFVEMEGGIELSGLGTYFAVIVLANVIQLFIILPLILRIRGHNPWRVLKGMFPALVVAFFSKSSTGTLPVTMNCAEKNVGVSPKVAGFVLPVCTTINMNGCAAFILVTVLYLMQNAGIEITGLTVATWIIVATVAAIGNAGVPMGCFFLSASLLAGMNVPILLMGVILPFYAVIDMVETALNVWSDSCVATMVDGDMKKAHLV